MKYKIGDFFNGIMIRAIERLELAAELAVSKITSKTLKISRVGKTVSIDYEPSIAPGAPLFVYVEVVSIDVWPTYTVKKINRIANAPYVEAVQAGNPLADVEYTGVVNIKETNDPALLTTPGIIHSMGGVDTNTNPLNAGISRIRLSVGSRTMMKIEGDLYTIDTNTTADGTCV